METKRAADPLKGFPIVAIVNVAWGDLDALGHVNNTKVFRYFEDARIAYLDAIGFVGGGRGRSVIGPILHSTMCRFRRPIGFPDTLRVGARVTDVGEDRLTMEHRVVSGQLGEVAAEGAGVIVAFDYAKQAKVALPAAVRTRLAALEKGVETDRTVRAKPRGR
jgi:acyl-CoA thioester hydrolase